MKTITAIITAIIIITLCATACANLYPETAKVVEVNYDEDTVIVETFTGFLFAFEGCEDWQEGDCASLIMDDGKTELIYDDSIVMAQYGAWELVNWSRSED